MVRADNGGVSQAFEFFEHTADIGVRVSGATLPELFSNAACAMYTALGELQRSKVGSQKSVTLQAESLEDLLHDWLQDLLFEVETRQMLYDEMAVMIQAGRLTATLGGGKIDFARSQVWAEIKAVTYHQLRVEQKLDGTWQATVIFDV